MPSSLPTDRATLAQSRRKAAQVMASRTGLAMPAVLGTLIVVATLASAIALYARSSYTLDVKRHWRMRDEWVLQAGLNRAAKALVTPGDPMREALFGGHPALFSLGDARISLALSRESEKIDVDFASPESVANLFAFALPHMPATIVAQAAARLRDMKTRRNLMSSPELLLPLDQRSSPVSDLLRRITTTLSGQENPSPPMQPAGEDNTTVEQSSTPSIQLETDGAPSRPIYRLTATMMAADGQPSGAAPPSDSIVVILSVNDARAFRIAEGHL